jgi:hypothetical protein
MMKIHDNVLKQIYGVNSIGRVPEKDIIVNVFKVRAMQNYSKIFFLAFFTSFDRARAVDPEKLFFSLHKYFLQINKYEKLGGYNFFQNVRNFLLNSCFQLLKIFFSDST